MKSGRIFDRLVLFNGGPVFGSLQMEYPLNIYAAQESSAAFHSTVDSIGFGQRRRVMRMIVHFCCLVLIIVFLLACPCPALEIEWASISTNPSFLLEPPNIYNVGGIDHSWAGAALRDPGQRDLAAFREEMVQPGRYAGGIGWDSLSVGTEGFPQPSF